jgi:hypothetical protein
MTEMALTLKSTHYHHLADVIFNLIYNYLLANASATDILKDVCDVSIIKKKH